MFDLPTTNDSPLAMTTCDREQPGRWGAGKVIFPDPQPARMETVRPDTARALTIDQMADRLRLLGSPTVIEDAELTADPDDYPLF